MNTATQNLENDHVQILRLIDVMEKITKSASPNTEHLELIVKIIREYADGLHHAKEEQLLFPLMVQKGFSNQSGPVAVMLNDHVEGRNYVKAMAQHIAMFKKGDASVVHIIYANMRGYADLLKNHISKENNVLFRMADNVLSNAEQESLLLDFTKVEMNTAENKGIPEYVSMIDELAGIYS